MKRNWFFRWNDGLKSGISERIGRGNLVIGWVTQTWDAGF
jgi:hypothetical protein